jgi:hypothetical protein
MFGIMKYYFTSFIIVIPLFIFAQKQGNVWYFGDHAGLDFNSGTPVTITNGQTYSPSGCPNEGTSLICDSAGALLFYTNGQKVWNKNHLVMPHGDNLLGNYSSTQSALIVPQPGSDRYFYVFTTDDFCEDDLLFGFRYSKIDIRLDNGLGDVLVEQKNIKLLDTVAEKLTAVRHANGVDYWIVVHKYYSDAFYVYKLTPTGITDTIISHIGSRHPINTLNQDAWAAIGQMKASPNGQKLCLVNGNSNNCIAEYFDFNNNTGVVSNCVNIQTDSIYNYYGVSFSPDNTKLYISCWLNGIGIFQFDLNTGNGNPDSVKASKTKITNYINGSNWALQLGIDGKIYVACGNSYLSVINYPNYSGINCNYTDSAIYLNGKICGSGLPNFIDSYNYSNTMFDCETIGIEEKNQNTEISLFPNPSDGEFSIETGINKISEIKIYTTLGEKVYKSDVNSEEKTINFYAPDGIYFVHIICAERTIVKKIIVQH